MQWDGIIRNAIAAFAIVITLGSSGMKFYSDFVTWRSQVTDELTSLRSTVDAIYCKLEPNSMKCGNH